MLASLFLVAVTCAVFAPSTASNELLFVQVVWRHGDRAPINSYPTNPTRESAWPYGYGELTELGMRQQLSLGKLLRRRYVLGENPLLSERYAPKEVYIRSTDVNRTLISAMSNLAGFFPMGRAGVDFPDGPEGKATWPSHWTPIPVHTVDNEHDHIGNVFAECPRAKEIDEFIRQSSEYKAVNQQFAGFFKYVSEKSGKQYNLDNINELYDIYYIESVYNITQPDWMTEKFLEQMRNVTHLANEFLYGISKPYIPELIKLRGGNMLKSMIANMQQKMACIDNEDPSCSWYRRLKFYAYSAHDTTVAALLTTFGDEERVIRGGLPHYTASVALELWRVEGVGPAVRILFHSAFHHGYHVITDFTKGCPLGQEYCPLDVFVRRSRKFLPKDIERECEARRKNYTPKHFRKDIDRSWY